MSSGIVMVWTEADGAQTFDPEQNGADVAMFADHWPSAIYYVVGGAS